MADIKIEVGAPADKIAPSGSSVPVTAAPKPADPAPPATKPSAPQPAETFQNIFNKAPAKESGPKMIESIVTGKTDASSKLKPILGSAPQLQKTLEQEKEYRQKRSLKASQAVFIITFLLALGAVLYFFMELSPSFNLFGPNTTARLTDVNKNLQSLQAKINKYRYLAAQLDLNRFSYAAAQFLDKTVRLSDPNVSAAEKTILTTEISELQTSIPVVLESIRKNLGQDIVIKTFRTESEAEMTEDEIRTQFENDLRASLQEDMNQIIAASANGTVNAQDLKLFENAMKLVGNSQLVGTLKGMSLDSLKKDLEDYKATQDSMLRSKLQKLFSSILSSTSSDIATIAALKSARITWSTVIKQIETVTAEADTNFGKGLYASLGGVIYKSYEFDTQSNKIGLSGETTTFDATNFTLISNLIDKMEESPYFKDAKMRSFSKSGTPEEGFTANFRLDLTMETDGQSPKNKVLTLGRDSLKERTGFRRIKR